MANELFTIDADFPGGNIVVDKIAGDDVQLHQDLRDTEGSWFYWCFRVRGAGGRRVTFQFSKTDKRGPIGARGPAVSLDGGITWRWLGHTGDDFYRFSYDFAPEQDDVRLGMGMTYTQEHFDRFLRELGPTPEPRRDVLCNSRKGRIVEKLSLGNPAAPHAVLIIARHHCCEMMASYVVEGILQAALANDPLGQSLRTISDIVVIPFVDKDGVEAGDQGKNRLPRDHNRDYQGASIYRETAAIRELVPRWVGTRKLTLLDIHCPWLRGGINEKLYQVGQSVPLMWERQRQFGVILEQVRKGSIVYRTANDLPFGQDWNTPQGLGNKGISISAWASQLPVTRLSGVLEVPYANAEGCEVNPSSARELGGDLACALEAFLRQADS